MIVTIKYVVGESCFRFTHPVSHKKPILLTDDASFKCKTGFTTEKERGNEDFLKIPYANLVTTPPLTFGTK